MLISKTFLFIVNAEVLDFTCLADYIFYEENAF